MNQKTLNAFIERDSIDYSKRYRFNPVEDGRCQTSRKGRIVLHRRLVNTILGINFPKTNLKVLEQLEKNGQFFGFIIKPVVEPQAERITIYRFKYGALLALNGLVYTLNLDVKRFQYSFISELLTLDDGSFGIRLTLEETRPWPEHINNTVDSELTLDEADQVCLMGELPSEQLQNDEEQIRALIATFLDWKTSQKNQTDSFEFKRNFADFSRVMNQKLFHISLPENLSELIAPMAITRNLREKETN